MAYDSSVTGTPGSVHSVCIVEECDWHEPRPAERLVRSHLAGHTVDEWAVTVDRWHGRAVAAESEVERLRARLDGV